jgi:Tol biopolymer transport system component
MRRIVVAGLTLLLSVGVASAQRSSYFSNPKQLTKGGLNSEAYWSPDGTKLVFQSRQEENGCDQVYVMNADGTGVKMVSTGQGVATSGYFMPDGKQILYSSTHGSDPACPQKPDPRLGQTWPIYPGYDLWVTDVDGAEPKRLTTTDGYDAKATVNWKTGRIVYTSNSSGDLELWSMDLDGKNQSKLTSAIGYDGEASFSPEKTSLVWRAHHPLSPEGASEHYDLLARNLTNPKKMEIFVGDGYGMQVKQITNHGCASLAPRFTPDGKRIVFASNMNDCDSGKFELFLVGADGHDLEQVTRLYGFTSFPEFSPDGKKIVFTSSFNAKSDHETNIFVADWNEGM